MIKLNCLVIIVGFYLKYFLEVSWSVFKNICIIFSLFSCIEKSFGNICKEINMLRYESIELSL